MILTVRLLNTFLTQQFVFIFLKITNFLLFFFYSNTAITMLFMIEIQFDNVHHLHPWIFLITNVLPLALPPFFQFFFFRHRALHYYIKGGNRQITFFPSNIQLLSQEIICNYHFLESPSLPFIALLQYLWQLPTLDWSFGLPLYCALCH